MCQEDNLLTCLDHMETTRTGLVDNLVKHAKPLYVVGRAADSPSRLNLLRAVEIC